MLGINVKRGVETTLERVFKSSNNEFGKLEFHWSGTTAGINFSRYAYKTDATIIFPSLDENSNIDNGTFTNLIGYALHELGHAWFTENAPWDKARNEYGAFVNNLINGLEDPRIERKVIESGYAPNSRVLFENLTNSILKRSGYVEPDDKKNIPFMLAIEGRRLNGYIIEAESVLLNSPYAKHLNWALKRAKDAKDTKSIVKIAVELYKRLLEDEQKAKDKPEDGKQGKDDNPVEGTSANDTQAPGEPGEPGESSDAPGESGESGEPGEPSDTTDKPSNSSSKSFEGGREVEPSQFIKDILKSHSTTADRVSPRPSALKPTYSAFIWS